jgi:hypothetical protein
LKKQPVDQNNGKGLPEEIVPSTWGRLILALKVYRPATWLLLLAGSLVLFTRDADNYIAWRGGSRILSSVLLVFSLLSFCDAFETLCHYTANNKAEDKILRMVTRDHSLVDPLAQLPLCLMTERQPINHSKGGIS